MGVLQHGGRPVLLAAGGTGGHLFPAQSLAEELQRRGASVHLITDARGGRYQGKFPADAVHVVASDTFRGRNPIALARTLWRIGSGVVASMRLMLKLKPAVLVGFGGYPSFPPLAAAWLLRIPTCLHEQNAVMGRANRALGRRATAIATSFPETAMVEARARSKVTHTGNPVRSNVVEAARSPYVAPDPAGAFNLLVFGGSQGARIFSDVVPGTIARLDKDLQARLHVTQQVRGEDLERVGMYYRELGIKAEVAAFFGDLPARIAKSHLVVARSGASTVAELAAIGRPAILVPLPHALDNDQLMNASALARAKAAWVLPQSSFTPHKLADELTRLMNAPDMLVNAAGAAQRLGRLDAVAKLADLVLRLAQTRTKTGDAA